MQKARDAIPITVAGTLDVPLDVLDRFWTNVDTSGGPDACWEWTAGRSKLNYGKFSLTLESGRRVHMHAHMFSYLLHIGHPPAGMFVHHDTCDNRPCVNPSHLKPATSKENASIRHARGRSRGCIVPGTLGVTRPAGYTPKPRAQRTKSEIFWSHVEKLEGEDACWIWTGFTDKKGYGRYNIGTFKQSHTVFTHRFAYENAVGPIPEGLYLLHDCPNGDRPDCCRPDHLRPGTQKQNMEDMVRKGRNKTRPRGSATRSAVLNEEKVAGILNEYTQGASPLLIAQTYKVSRECIRAIVAGETWKHVPRPAGFTHRTQRGMQSPLFRVGKIDEADVRIIRQRFAQGVRQAQLAREYGMTRSNVCAIVKRRAWAHVE